MAVSRIRSLKELSNQSDLAGTNPDVRDSLEIYSKSEVDGLIGNIDLSPYALSSTVSTVSGNLETMIDNLSTVVDDLSAGLTIDINNLDIAFTSKIDSDCVQSAGVTGAETTVTGSLTITINGTPYKLGVVQ